MGVSTRTLGVDSQEIPTEPVTPRAGGPNDGADDSASKGSSSAPKSTGAPKRTPADRKLATSLSSTYQAVGVSICTVGIHRGGDARFLTSGQSFIEKADELAEAWMQLADQNPKVKAALRKFTETSAMAGLVGMHFACMAPFLLTLLPSHIQPSAAMAMGMEMPVSDDS